MTSDESEKMRLQRRIGAKIVDTERLLVEWRGIRDGTAVSMVQGGESVAAVAAASGLSRQYVYTLLRRRKGGSNEPS